MAPRTVPTPPMPPDVRLLNANVPILAVSATTGEGLDAWIDWLDRGVAGTQGAGAT